uniref:Kunitz-type U15-theraphotoxin-Hhn1p n=1 Tax=Cyriopagopus hainanus TaxID=2781057 RepID=VKTP1_CYRHA|nr:RecName: Full=Kunitz-type U15-theraphotoxin-Hhn1p; Short=U15-TRTX-Hhn1p; AltName: Full=Kunitz-type serine protease inhibitor hainantoxin-XI-16; Short=HNTX-XI-16; Flags: Precursor [Haplopelma hainanum]ADB56950.1 HNTX-XI-16 precursor [Haplopelma hainanum]
MGIARILSAVLFLSVLFVVTFPTLLSADHHDGRIDTCRLPSDRGRCKASFERWYFNGTTCTKFVYGGYGGNDNRFPTEKACMKRCVKA